MKFVVEGAHQSLSKYGEELCGDHVEVLKKDDGTIFVLSDGLGSGVKANILATLTTKIAIGLVEKNLPLEEIVETIIETLPICEVREMAYSTLAVLKVYNDGRAQLIEIDAPPAFLFKDGEIKPLEMNEITIKGKLIKEARFNLELGDSIFITSDGVVHAGIGGLMDFGLGWDGVANHLEDIEDSAIPFKQMIDKMLNICQAYYLMEPGDDCTVLGARLRKPRNLTIMTGPPTDPERDKEISRRLNRASGRTVICGGTTSQIFAREMDRELECTFQYEDPDIPPISFIDGVSLVTEGLLTLNKTVEYLQEYQYPELPPGKDGASLLAKEIMKCDKIDLLVGRAANEAHQSLNLPANLGVRTQVIERLMVTLEDMHKKVNIEWY